MVKFANNNSTDMDGYNKFMKRQQELARKTEEKTRRIRIEKNLDAWETMLDYPWNIADMSYFSGRPVELATEAINSKQMQSFIVMSGEKGGKTFFTHALIKEYIKAGLITPSQIRITDIREGITSINGMFKAREWKDKFFDPKAKLLVVEGCSEEFAQLKLKDQDQFWAEVFAHCQENKKILIITYSLSEEEEKKDLLLPSITLNKGFNVRAVKNSKIARITEDTRNPEKDWVE